VGEETEEQEVRRILIAPSALLLLGVLLGSGSALAKSYTAETYRSEILVRPDGTLHVTEEVTFRFDGAFHYVYRTIPTTKTDGIENIESPDPIRVRSGSSTVEVRWDFPEVRDANRTFRLSYDARGVIYRRDGGWVLRWNAFPYNHQYRIESARSLLSLPEGNEPSVVHTRPDVPARRTAGGIEFDVGALSRDRTFLIEATLPGDAAGFPVPEWQGFHDRWNRAVPPLLASAAVVLVLGILGIIRSRKKIIPEALTALGRTIPAMPTPPSDLPPAIAGAIRDGRVSFPHAVATVLDLAARGYVRFENDGKKSRWGSDKRFLRRLRPAEDLAAWERKVFDPAFKDADADGRVPLEKAWKSLYGETKAFSASLTAELERRGDYDPAIRTRSRSLNAWIAVAAALTVLSAIATGVMHRTLGPAPIPIAIAFLVVFFVAIGARLSIPLTGVRGKEQALGWTGFSRYLKSASREGSPVDAERFNAWLAYAAAFSVADRWMKAGSRWGLAVPDWFVGAAGGSNGFEGWIPIFASGGAHGAGVGGAGGAAGGGGSGAG
jgi:uncharacterized membrane protein